LYYACVDDKKLGGVLKKLGLNEIKAMEEVNIFRGDGMVVHITNPKSKFVRSLRN
jgi:nascent polypeptide-associated complex subunit beta